MGINGEIAGTLDASYYKGCGERQGVEREVLYNPKKTVAYGISSYDSNAMKSPNPHSGIYEADTSRTLDLNGGNPACNQGGIAVLAVDCRNGREGVINGTLQAKSTGGMSLNLNNVIRTRTDT